MNRFANGRCYYCKTPFNHDDPLSDRYPTKDHKVPRSKGGARLGLRNIVMACRQCNSEKADMSKSAFMEYLEITKSVPGGAYMRAKVWRAYKKGDPAIDAIVARGRR